MAMAAVSNLGRDANYFGHPFAAFNFFGYGLLAWDPAALQDCDAMLHTWARLTYSLPEMQERLLVDVLDRSASIVERYSANLGLGWMVTPNSHYGPNPGGYEFQSWGTYHRTNHEAVGIARGPEGTGYTEQYPTALAAMYANPATCPEQLLLFFHRLPYTFQMQDGRTLLQRLYDDHFEGYAAVKAMVEQLGTLKLPSPDREEVTRRAALQVHNAHEWCDILNTFFYRYSGIPDEKGRTIYD